MTNKSKNTNVVNMDQFRKGRDSDKRKALIDDGKPGVLVDLEAQRTIVRESERRQVTRTVLSQFVGAFVVINGKGLQASTLYDVSETGLSFDMPVEVGEFVIGEEIGMRIYLNHDTYFPFSVKITNIRYMEQGSGIVRHGAAFNKKDPSYECLSHFVKFLQEVSIVSRKDRGERIVGRVD